MSLSFKNPAVLLGWGYQYPGHKLTIGELGSEDRFNTDDYDIEVILTPKFKPGWFGHENQSTNGVYTVRWFDVDPETLDPGEWFRTTKPVEVEK